MTPVELSELIEQLRYDHPGEFETWYDKANFPSIEDYAEIGFLLTKYYLQEER